MIPFGFSAGDFVALGGLVIKVTKALKDHGGAADEYQHVVFELQKFKSILDQVEQLEPEVETSNTDSQTILCELVGRSQTILQSFLTSINKFQTSLGEQSVKHKQRFTSDWRKAQWALFMSREVGRLRGELNSCALLIILQLQLLSQKSDLNLQQDIANTKDAIMASVHGQDANIEYIVTAIKGQLELSKRLESAIDELNVRSLISDTVTNVAPQVRQKTGNNVTAEPTIAHAHQKYPGGSPRRRWIEVSHTIRFLVNVDEIGDDPASQRAAISRAFKDQEAIVVDGYDTHLTTWHTIIIHTYDMFVHPWSSLVGNISIEIWDKASNSVLFYLRDSARSLSAEVSTLLRRIVASNIQILQILQEVNQQISKTNSATAGPLQSTFKFEDYLGRVHRVSFEFCQNQEMLHAFIRYQHKEHLPGSEAVKNKQYALHIVQNGTLLPLDDKAQLLPNMSIVMSLEITISAFTHFIWADDDPSFLAAKCIRCKCLLEDMSGLIESKGLPSPASWKCSSCGLGISALPEVCISSSVPPVSAEDSRGYAEWAKRVHYRTFALNDGSGLSRPVDDVWPDEFFDTL